MPALKGTEVSLSYVQCFLYLVSSLTNVFIFHSTWFDTFCTDLIFVHSLLFQVSQLCSIIEKPQIIMISILKLWT